jgi:hypothetical protein
MPLVSEYSNSFVDYPFGYTDWSRSVEDFAAHGLTKCRKEFRYQGFHCIILKATTDGDIVCVLGNSEIPFILRPVGDKYELVGDAYVEHRSTDFLPKVITFTIQ